MVATSCLSALTSNVRSDTGRPRSRSLDHALLPTLVDEFFVCGARNYIGIAWEVSDAGAVLFSQKLYETFMPNLPGIQSASLAVHRSQRADIFVPKNGPTARSGPHINTSEISS